MTRIIRDPRGPIQLDAEIRGQIGAIREVWAAKRGARRYPSRQDFDLPDLAPWLRHVEIVHVERGAPGRVRYRYGFVGTAINAIDGTSITGRYADEVFKGLYENITSDYEAVLQSGEPNERVFVEMVNNRGQVRTYCKLTLPLADDGASIDALLVMLLEVERP